LQAIVSNRKEMKIVLVLEGADIDGDAMEMAFWSAKSKWQQIVQSNINASSYFPSLVYNATL
jgi:hypothetical protein